MTPIVFETLNPVSFETSTPSPFPVDTPQPGFSAPLINYEVINEYPHDSGAFTEGLVFHKNILYETTGLKGRSSIRKVDLESGRPQKIRYLPDEYFGEGLAIIDEKMIWITWQSNTGFVFDLNSFDIIDDFSYNHEGWGLTCDGTSLYMSDGTDIIHILDPANFSEISTISVTDNGKTIDQINELEIFDQALYANIWKTDLIAKIDPVTGETKGWLDLSPLKKKFTNINQPVDVLNGIAFNPERNSIFVTGKFWPYIFEIKILGS